MYTEESLDLLRQSIDIVEVISEHVSLKRNGATYKACCPFHFEKTPSFVVNTAGTYYHCFGCSAHGDAIDFLMKFLGYSFTEAALFLSKKFHVELSVKTGPKEGFTNQAKQDLRQINFEAEKIFRKSLYCLPEAHIALKYLFHRGITPDTIDRFGIGYAPEKNLFVQAMKDKGIPYDILSQSGFFSGNWFLFSKRVIFPIYDHLGHTIGFSSRKLIEDSGGGKYLNTPETLLFKKSRIFFGLNFCRRRIAKEKKVILVEGQIDCLQMIESGLDCTLAVQGTAFTEEHVKELQKLGIERVVLLFDGDPAGKAAALKVGDVCQSFGLIVSVCLLPQGQDPDSYLLVKGVYPLIALLDTSEDYLSFLFSEKTKGINLNSPMEKAKIIEELSIQIKKWSNSIVVHESLKQLASLMQLPENIIKGIQHPLSKNAVYTAFIKDKTSNIRADIILETDILRCLLFCKPDELMYPNTVRHYFELSDFKYPPCHDLLHYILDFVDKYGKCPSLEQSLEIVQNDEQTMKLFTQRLLKPDSLQSVFLKSMQKLSDHKWKEQQSLFRRTINHIDQNNTSVLEDYIAKRKEKIIISMVL